MNSKAANLVFSSASLLPVRLEPAVGPLSLHWVSAALVTSSCSLRPLQSNRPRNKSLVFGKT